MEGTDVRPVEVSREMADSLYELQRFLIRLEEGTAEVARSEVSAEQISLWADLAGILVGSWQAHDVIKQSVELSTISYVVYTNPERTLMIRCWRGDIADGKALWTLESAMRDEPGAIWRAPQPAGTTTGDLSMLRDYIDAYSNLDPGTEEIERVRQEVA